MLILTRKVHQEIVLGNGVRITVVAIRGKQVRVGIQAPPHFHIRREELAPKPVAEEVAIAPGLRTRPSDADSFAPEN